MSGRITPASEDGVKRPATWSDRALTHVQALSALRENVLATEDLVRAILHDDPSEVADALAAADLHLAQSRDDVESAFRGIAS